MKKTAIVEGARTLSCHSESDDGELVPFHVLVGMPKGAYLMTVRSWVEKVAKETTLVSFVFGCSYGIPSMISVA